MGLGDADADGGGTPALPTIMMMLLVAVVAVGKLCPDVFVFALHVCRRSASTECLLECRQSILQIPRPKLGGRTGSQQDGQNGTVFVISDTDKAQL